MASIYASKNEDLIEKIILLAAYPSVDLSCYNLKMLSIYGSRDKVLNRDIFEENKSNAPKDTCYFDINGGNHAYFGSYGQQDKDGKASITAKEQQDITVRKIVSFLN